MRVERNIFWFVGVFMIAGAVLYAASTDEDAGTVMLALAGGFGVMTAAYLWVSERARRGDDEADGDEPWFPDASIWPFVIGLAAFFVFNGLILGTWFLVPGGGLFTLGVLGWATQTRHRT